MSKQIQTSCQVENCKNMATFFFHITVEIDDRALSLRGQKVPMQIPLCKDHSILVELSADHGSFGIGLTKINEEMSN